jgi:heterodisulfide reductase subunit B
VLSCPLCEYNLGGRQQAVMEKHAGLASVPVYYISQLLAMALGLGEEVCRFDLSRPEHGDVLRKAAA